MRVPSGPAEVPALFLKRSLKSCRSEVIPDVARASTSWAAPRYCREVGPSELLEQCLTFLWLAVDGLRMVSSGLLGLGLGDSQELKKDWMKGSRFCPLWRPQDRDVSGSGAAEGC